MARRDEVIRRAVYVSDITRSRSIPSHVLEGVRNGVPFLCWPYFSDQFLDQNYITDLWRTGLAVSPDAGGVVMKEELRSKVEQVVSNGEIKERAQLFRDATCRAISEGGASYENFQKFLDLLHE